MARTPTARPPVDKSEGEMEQDIRTVRGELPTEEMRERWSHLKRQLAELHGQYQKAADPLIKEMERLNAHRPVRLVPHPPEKKEPPALDS